MKWRIIFTTHAQKDAKKLAASSLIEKTLALIEILKENPFQSPPPYEKLIGDLSGAHSRRINIQHKLAYQVLNEGKIVKVLRMWTHYE